jgi:phosphodiesterase/alkaline phosphatase D-like protein
MRAITIPEAGAVEAQRSPLPRRAAALAIALLAVAAVLVLRPGDASHHGTPAAPVRAHAHPLASLPSSAVGAVSAAVGADSREYRVRASRGGIAAENHAQRLGVRFTDAGTQVRSGATHVGLGRPAIGFGSALRPLRTGAPSAHANGVAYAGGGVREWYRNGPYGVEQGFDIQHAPAGRASGPLTIAVPLSGNAHAALVGGRTLTLSHAGGPTLRYTDLTATDARGRTLHSWLELRAGAVLLRIDAAGARYPLRVDPLVQQGAKLTGSGEVGQGSFGLSVAISANGNEVLVGGPTENTSVGAVWAFARSGSTWVQQGSKITATGEIGQGQFGYTLALSEDGTTALIGGGKDNSAVGAAWVFTRSGSTWTQQGEKLTGGEEVGAGHFGCCSVALSSDGNTALVGGYADNTSVGAAWVFTRSGSTWSQQGPKILAGEETGAAHFGYAVALSNDGNTALIGGGNDNNKVGAAWVFTRSGSTWTQQGPKLTGSGETGGGQLGYSVALSADGKLALVGAGADAENVGAVWTFTRSGSTWSQSGSKLTAAEEIGAGHFGCCGVALSADGSIALIGGYVDNASVGAAWEYHRTGSSWTQLGAKLTGGEEIGAASFGRALGLTADATTAVIGGAFDNEDIGAAWIFSAKGQPGVVTGAASGVAQKSATLNATVNPEGETVSDCHFEYGTTESYGTSIPCSSLPGSGILPVAVSASVAGLTPSTLYHFRIVATNPTGTSTGTDGTFTTTASQPPAVVTKPASAVAQTSATLNATVNPEDEPVSDCHFEYGKTMSYGTSIPCSGSPGSGTSPVPVSASLTGLTPNSTYHFRIVATNPIGTSTGTDGSFKTTESARPAVVTEPATSVAQTTATLNATVNPEDEPVSDCHFEYGTTESYGTSIPCASSPGSGANPVPVNASVTGLTPNTTYHFRIVATNPIGTSTGADRSFKTPFDVPAAVTGAATRVGELSAQLNATVNPEGDNVTACHFEYGTSESYGASVPCASLPGSGTSPVPVSASLTGLTPNTTYHFRIVATNSGGTGGGSDGQFATPAAGAPELGRCVTLAKATGKYKASACTTKSTGENTGKFEWLPWPAAKNGFTVALGAVTLETVKKSSVKCTGGSFGGEYDGPRHAEIAITLTGCTVAGAPLSVQCGTEPVEVHFAPLQAQLGIIKKTLSAPTVGWDLTPAAGPDVATITCGANEFSITGSAIGQVTVVDKMSSTFTFKYKATVGKQSPEKFEGGLKDTLALHVGAGVEQIGLTLSAIPVNEELLEIKAL